MNRIMKLTWFWKCENYFCYSFLFIYCLRLFCAYIFGFLVVFSSVRYLDSWVDLFCLKECFTLVSWLMHLAPHFCRHVPTVSSKFHLNCHVYTAEGKNETTFCLPLQSKMISFLKSLLLNFFLKFFFVHCCLLFHSFRDCVVGKLATAVLTASMRFYS